MRGGNDPALVARWRGLAEREAGQAPRRTLGPPSPVFFAVPGGRQVWQRGLEGWNVNESQLMREIRQEGRQEGRVEGAVETGRGMVVRVLEKRFPGKITDALRARIEKSNDPTELERWHDLALS